MSGDLAPLFTALNLAMAESGYVQKTGRNEYHQYSYASEADLMESLRPALVKHGLMLIPDIQRTDIQGTRTFVYIDYTLCHTSGATFGPIGGIGEGMDKGDKALYKAITGAHKYMYYKLFAIATGDDPEADSTTDKAAAELPPPAPAVTNNANEVEHTFTVIQADYAGADDRTLVKCDGAKVLIMAGEVSFLKGDKIKAFATYCGQQGDWSKYTVSSWKPAEETNAE
jgi:hypothetical protein